MRWDLRVQAASVAMVLGISYAVPAAAVFIRDDVPLSAYLAHTNNYPGFAAAGFVLQGLSTPTLRTCSGTLVAATLFLTAAHCVADMQPRNLFVGFDNNFPSFNTALSPNVSSITINPAFVQRADAHDMAILRLSSPATASAAPLITLNPVVSTIAFLGYGAQGTNGKLLSSGLTPMPGATNALGVFNSLDRVTSNDYFLNDFDGPGQGPLFLEGAGAPGDSGAGAFLRVNLAGQVTSYLIGVLVGGEGTQIPTYGNIDFWARIREESNLDFLRSFPEIRIVEVGIPEPGTMALVFALLLSLELLRWRAARERH